MNVKGSCQIELGEHRHVTPSEPNILKEFLIGSSHCEL